MQSAPPPSRVCAKHGVVLDPFGHCVLCRREDADEDDDPSGARKAVVGLVALLLIVGAALVWKGSAARPPPPVIHVAAAPPTTTPEIAAAPVLDDLDEARERAAVASQNRAEAERREALEKQIRRVPIRIYTTQRCPLCKTATTYLAEHGLTWEEIDVERDREALAALRKLRPEPSVPTLVVGEEVIVGFGPGALMGAVYREAEKKVR